MKRLVLIFCVGYALGALLCLAVWITPAAWYLFNIAMRNETFANGFALVGLGIVLCGGWRLLRRVAM